MRKIILCALSLAGCQTLSDTRRSVSSALGTGEVLAISGIEGRWAGPVTPTDPACGQTTTGLMTVGADGFGFDPFGGTTVITGTVANGQFSGTLTRAAPSAAATLDAGTPAARAPKPSGPRTLSIAFSGTAKSNGDQTMIAGDLVSGHCQWRVSLKRA